MKNLTKFILEKLKINSNSKIINKSSNDPASWEVDDIICFYGFHIEFYKIIKRTEKYFEFHNIPIKMISGYFNSAKYECIPDIDKESKSITKGRLTKDNRLIIDGVKSHAELWDGNTVEGHGNF